MRKTCLYYTIDVILLFHYTICFYSTFCSIIYFVLTILHFM